MTLITLLGCRSVQAPEEVLTKKQALELPAGEEAKEEQAQIKLPGEEFYSDFSNKVEWVERRRFQTKHYVVESNCNEKILKRYGEMLEAFYLKWCELVCKPTLKHRLDVRIYGSHEEFMHYSRRPGGVGGFYGGGRVTAYHGRFGKTGFTHTVLFHEGTHQIHDAVIWIRRAQIWFTEGLACIFETLAFDKKGRLQPAFNTFRLKRVQKSIRKDEPMALKELLSTPQSKFAAPHYAYAYLFVYYLLNTTKKNNKIFRDYWQILAKDGEPRESPKFIALVGGKKKLKAMEKRWHKWVLSLESGDTPEQARKKSLED